MRWVYIGLLVWAVMSIPVALLMGMMFALGLGRKDGNEFDGDDDDGLPLFVEPYGDVVAFPPVAQSEALTEARSQHASATDGVSGLRGRIA